MFKDLSSLLPCAAKRAGIQKQVDAIRAQHVFSDLVDKLLHKDLVWRVKPLQVRNKTLMVSSFSGLAVSQLRHLESHIVQEINSSVGHEIVRWIHYTS